MRTWTLLALALALVLATVLVASHHHRSEPVATAPTAAASAASPSGFVAPAAPVQLPHTTADLQKFLGVLATAGGGPELDGAIADAYFALRKAVLADPEVLRAVEAFLVDADATSPEMRVALAALVGASTPEAQAALVHLAAARKGDVDFLTRFVPTISFVKEPTRELEAAVRGLSTDTRADVRTVANLSLGVMAAGLDQTQPARAREIVASYTARLEGADDETLRRSLEVLGNAGTPDAAHAVERYVADPRPEVRADALEALRRVPTADAEATLLGAASRDTERDVRSRAVMALSMRTPTDSGVRAQIAMLATETDETIARNLLSNVWSGLGVDRELVVATLTQTAASHPLASVQEQARAMLKGMAKT